MQLMLTNKGPTPCPMASADEGGWANFLPCNLRTAFPFQRTANVTVGFDAGAVDGGLRDAEEPQIEEYKTYGQAWIGRDVPEPGTTMPVDVLVENFASDVTLTGSEGEPVTLKAGESVRMTSTNLFQITGTAETEPGGGGGDIDPPDAGDVTGTLTSFTAASPTEVTMDAQDDAMLEVGSTMTLEALTGDPAAMAAINGVTATVLSKGPVTLDVDLSAVDVTGLTADFLLPEAPVP